MKLEHLSIATGVMRKGMTLRDFFEVDRRHVVLAALKSLAEEGSVDPGTVAAAREKLGINPDQPDPTGC